MKIPAMTETLKLLQLLDDKFIEQRFREELKAAGVSRSSIPKRLYRAHLEAFAVGWRKSILNTWQNKTVK